MKIKNLIKELKKFDPECEVVIPLDEQRHHYSPIDNEGIQEVTYIESQSPFDGSGYIMDMYIGGINNIRAVTLFPQG